MPTTTHSTHSTHSTVTTVTVTVLSAGPLPEDQSIHDVLARDYRWGGVAGNSVVVFEEFRASADLTAAEVALLLGATDIDVAEACAVLGLPTGRPAEA